MRFLSSLLFFFFSLFLLLSPFSCQLLSRRSSDLSDSDSYWLARNAYYRQKDLYWSVVRATPAKPLGGRMCMGQTEVSTAQKLIQSARDYADSIESALMDRESRKEFRDRSTMPINGLEFWVEKYRKNHRNAGSIKSECESIRVATRWVQRQFDRFAPAIEAKLGQPNKQTEFKSAPEYSISPALAPSISEEEQAELRKQVQEIGQIQRPGQSEGEAELDEAEVNSAGARASQRSTSVRVNVDID